MRKLFYYVLIISVLSFMVFAACAKPASEPAPAPTPTPAPASDKPIELRFSAPHPEQAGLVKAWTIPWINDINEASGGKVNIKLFPAGTLAKGPDSYDAVVSGICDLTYANPEEIPGRFPLGDLTCMPMLYKDSAAGSKAMYETIEKYMADTEFKEVKVLATMSLVPSQFHSNQLVDEVADFKGLKIRSGGQMGAWIMESIQATPITISDTSEIYSSLERGLIDGVFFVPEGVLAFGFKDVTTHRTWVNMDTKTHYVAMNKQVWESLPADVKKVFEEHCGAEASYHYSSILQEALTGAGMGLMGYDKEVGNPGFTDLAPGEEAKLKEAIKTGVWDKWVEEMEKKGLPGQEALDYCLQLVEQYSAK